jgi:hypothetical protein
VGWTCTWSGRETEPLGDHQGVKLLTVARVPPAPPGTLSERVTVVRRLDRREFFERALGSPWLLGSLLIVGIALRLARFLSERALWLDESFVAINLMNRSYSELLGTLDFGQGAPPAFLIGQKLVLETLGDSERALRLLPFVSGIVALFLFYAVARKLLTPLAVPLALLLFAVMKPLVVYSAELKQYGFDVAVVLALLLVFLKVLDRAEFRLRDALVLAAAGAAAVWFSHPAVLVLVGVGTGTAFAFLPRGGRRAFALLTVPAVAWVVSFLAMYALTLREVSHIERATGQAAGDHGWPARNVYLLFVHLDALSWMAATLAPILVLAGAAMMWAIGRKRPVVVVGAGMALATVAAGYVGKYPVGGRFVLFLLPVAILFLAEGAVRLIRVLPRDLAVTFALLIALLLVAAPLKRAATGELIQPPNHEEIKPVLAYLGDRWTRGDTLYVTGSAQYALRYYLECSDCEGAVPERLRSALQVRTNSGPLQTTPALISDTPLVVIGRKTRLLYNHDVRELRGRARVWALFTHKLRSRRQQLEPFEFAGRRLECSPVHGVAFACLYDLSPPRPRVTPRSGSTPYYF